jgi:anti-anti-sigma regulatory factor
MPGTQPPKIHVAVAKERLYLEVEPRATHDASLVAESLVANFLAYHPDHPQIVMNLGSCVLVDSTFAGWMLRLRRRLSELDGRTIISACSEQCRSTLNTMGLTSFFAFEQIEPPQQTQEITCDGLDEDSPEAIELMLRAHEDLAETSPNNKETFKPVADLLRRELDKKHDADDRNEGGGPAQS